MVCIQISFLFLTFTVFNVLWRKLGFLLIGSTYRTRPGLRLTANLYKICNCIVKQFSNYREVSLELPGFYKKKQLQCVLSSSHLPNLSWKAWQHLFQSYAEKCMTSSSHASAYLLATRPVCCSLAIVQCASSNVLRFQQFASLPIRFIDALGLPLVGSDFTILRDQSLMDMTPRKVNNNPACIIYETKTEMLFVI